MMRVFVLVVTSLTFGFSVLRAQFASTDSTILSVTAKNEINKYYEGYRGYLVALTPDTLYLHTVRGARVAIPRSIIGMIREEPAPRYSPTPLPYSDTSLITIHTKSSIGTVGKLVSEDSSWVTIIDRNGWKEWIARSTVDSISHQPVSREAYSNLNPPVRHFEAYFAPLVSAGEMNSSSQASGLAYTVGAAFAFQIPHISRGLYLLPAFESRSFALNDDANNRYEFTGHYLSVTAGVSVFSWANVGIAFGIPTSLSLTAFSSNSTAQPASLPLSIVNTFIEPRAGVSLPLTPASMYGNMLTAFIEVGAPFQPLYNADILSPLTGKTLGLSTMRFLHFQLGFSYILPIYINRGMLL